MFELHVDKLVLQVASCLYSVITFSGRCFFVLLVRAPAWLANADALWTYNENPRPGVYLVVGFVSGIVCCMMTSTTLLVSVLLWSWSEWFVFPGKFPWPLANYKDVMRPECTGGSWSSEKCFVYLSLVNHHQVEQHDPQNGMLIKFSMRIRLWRNRPWNRPRKRPPKKTPDIYSPELRHDARLSSHCFWRSAQMHVEKIWSLFVRRRPCNQVQARDPLAAAFAVGKTQQTWKHKIQGWFGIVVVFCVLGLGGETHTGSDMRNGSTSNSGIISLDDWIGMVVFLFGTTWSDFFKMMCINWE